MLRTLEPEILDSLSPDDPAAQANRRDLRLINALMGNHRWLRHMLDHHLKPNEPCLELGAGEGDLGRLLHPGVELFSGLDLWPRPVAWPSHWAWHSADLLTFKGYAAYPAIVGNLIFHQFSEAQLGTLGQALSPHTRLILACEPARRRLHQVQLKLLWPLGLNYVSRHDAHVSIAAGFTGDELPRLLGLDPTQWSVKISTTFLGAYRMVALRRN